MKLFKYEGYNLTISEEAFMLKPFKELWRRDKSKNKEKALQELAYIYFMEDSRSDYQVYIDKEERSTQVKLGEGMPESWKPDKAVLDAMQFYSSFKSESALLLEDIRVAITKLREFIKTIDLSATDDKGKPIYTLNTYTATIKQIPDLITSLDEAERTIAKENIQSDKVRGSVEKAMFEDDL
jgi:hypothetical protein